MTLWDLDLYVFGNGITCPSQTQEHHVILQGVSLGFHVSSLQSVQKVFISFKLHSLFLHLNCGVLFTHRIPLGCILRVVVFVPLLWPRLFIKSSRSWTQGIMFIYLVFVRLWAGFDDGKVFPLMFENCIFEKLKFIFLRKGALRGDQMFPAGWRGYWYYTRTKKMHRYVFIFKQFV